VQLQHGRNSSGNCAQHFAGLTTTTFALRPVSNTPAALGDSRVGEGRDVTRPPL
jgi:hypothetical protein